MSTKDQVTELQNRIVSLEQENQKLHDTVEYLTQKLFGSSSEKTSALGIDGQLSLFDETETFADPNADEPDLQDVSNYRKTKFKGQREKLLEKLPHEKKLCSLVEEDRFCDSCGNPLYSIGEEFVRTEIEFIPAKIRVIDYYRETFECRACRKEGKDYIEKSPMPYPVIQHSYASPSTITWVIHQKYEMAVPLYRQEKEWEALGVSLSRGTMANWIMVSYREWLSPVVGLLHQKLLKEMYLHADETPVQVFREPNRKNTTNSYMWVYSSGKHSKHPIRIFDYQPGRSGKYAKAFLDGFKGYLHTDAYKGYEQVEGVTRCLCWSHLRRYFVDALPKDTASPQATLPARGIAYINELFELEKQLESLSPEVRKSQRLEQETPVLEAFWTWVGESLPKVMLKSKIGEAFVYALNQKPGFMKCLLDGSCSISNNLAENSIRPFTIGRKNWLFSGSPKGAASSAGVYTLVETAKANGLNPAKYIHFILKDIPGSAFKEYPEFLEEYMPWDPLVQRNCK